MDIRTKIGSKGQSSTIKEKIVFEAIALGLRIILVSVEIAYIILHSRNIVSILNLLEKR